MKRLFTIATFALFIARVHAADPDPKNYGPYFSDIIVTNFGVPYDLIGTTVCQAENAFSFDFLNSDNLLPPGPGFYVQATSTVTNYALALGAQDRNQWTSFGGYGDGQFVSDICVTSGVDHVSSPIGHWGSTNIGNMIGLCACGTNAMTWFTWITNVISPTDIMVSNPPPCGCTNMYYCVYGSHDDSSAFQSAINYAASIGGAKILVMPGVYLMETNFTDPNENNAMIIAPFVNAQGGPWYNNSSEIDIEGKIDSQQEWAVNNNYFLSPTPQETVFVIMQIGNDIVSSNCIGSSFFDCRPYDQGASTTYGTMTNSFTENQVVKWPVNNIRVRFKNISFVSSYDPHLCVINLLGAIDGSGLDNCEIIGGENVGPAFSANPPRGTNSIAYLPPGVYNGTFGECYRDVFSGFFTGTELGLFNGRDCTWNLCSNCVDCYLQDSVDFFSHGMNVSDSPNILANTRGTSSGYGCNFDFDFTSIQGTMTGESGWWTNNNFTVQAISDQGGHFNGHGRMFLMSTNANGMPVKINELFQGAGIDVSYLHTAIANGIVDSRHWILPQAFDNRFTSTTGAVTGVFYPSYVNITSGGNNEEVFSGTGNNAQGMHWKNTSCNSTPGGYGDLAFIEAVSQPNYNYGPLAGSAPWATQPYSIATIDPYGHVNMVAQTNGLALCPNGLELSTNGVFSLSAITNAIWPSTNTSLVTVPANWATGWIGFSNTSIVAVKLINGNPSFSVLDP